MKKRRRTKTTKHNIKYIIVHSTQTQPHEIPPPTTAHYSIYSDGRIVKNNPVAAVDGCVDVAFIGGKNKEGKVADTKTERQAESLFNQLIALTELYPEAAIKAADQFFDECKALGFNLAQWLANYLPKYLAEAA
jgi:hypothetical protein